MPFNVVCHSMWPWYAIQCGPG